MTTPEPGCLRRLSREFRDMNKYPSKYWTLSPVDDSLMKWTGFIHKLDDKRHRCRKYRLTIDVPANYPFRYPTIKFIDRVRCENVYEDGTLCLDILGPMWSPSFTLPLLMESIVSVLTDAPVTGLINKPIPPDNTLKMRLREWTRRANEINQVRTEEVVEIPYSNEIRNVLVRT
jgi:ubiquitin-conjugating enzyme E2 D/E